MLFLGRRLRTKLPICHKALEFMPTDSISDFRMQREEETAKEFASRQHTKDLPQLELGQEVLIQDQQSGLWTESGEVSGIRDTGRSYEVTTDSGHAYIRNRRFLRPLRKQQQQQAGAIIAHFFKPAKRVSFRHELSSCQDNPVSQDVRIHSLHSCLLYTSPSPRDS